MNVEIRNNKVYSGARQIGELGCITPDSNEIQHHPDLAVPSCYKPTHLPAGDYLIAGKHRLIGVERKDFTDLLNTFVKRILVAPHERAGRLGHQLARVQEAYGEAVLIIEWSGVGMLGPHYFVKGRMRRITDTALWGYLDSLQERGVRIRITTGIERTMAMLGTMLRAANTKRMALPT